VFIVADATRTRKLRFCDFLQIVYLFRQGSMAARLSFVFRFFDFNDTGIVGRSEVLEHHV
jgi:Ca2+-binding EF-hand superfamily protein